MNDVKILLELLTRDDLLKREAAEALVHALVDIKLSINRVL
jgi:IMP dehydrogenase/GMP reductase